MQFQKNIIEVKNLNFSYEKQKVLEDINFTIEKNDFLTIIGPNGGGKSTLLKLILGINKLQNGFIKVFGKNHLEEIQNIGYVPQNTNVNLKFPITVLEVVMMGQNSFIKRMFGYKKDEKQKALEVLKKVSMEDFANNRISNLSGGQRQRVLIARALFSNPKILLLDEPTSNIDINGCEQVYLTLQELNKKIPIIVVSHDISVILKYASKAFYINKKMTQHDLSKMKDEFKSIDSHVCEIELLEMLGKCRC
ncbi:metal ABC transporter ATP-binding protein [Arcobacter arenosus]|uniref:ABC transporter ATP-binding protein n=1 Tax=Arcobacter arenosus TaxID=2576037 RepID=A0A5R8Y552_9BACT|nr:ABC transporter ATP-binding protein [Arcobacter arenosus]TLP41196.1 ABC transporter ATP-binding protein [Arcobacter arenosus]